MVEFNTDMLSCFYERLKGRGNTLLLKITMFVGGNDMYGRIVVTKLVYTKEIIWDSPSKIDLGLFPGKLVSEILFDNDQIIEIVDNRNLHYKV